MTQDEQRGYSKGYAAGLRRKAKTVSKEDVEALREDFIQRMMIAIAPQIISSPWGRTVDGKWKPDTGAKAIMKTVREASIEAADKCSFNVIARGFAAPKEPQS